MIEIEFSKQYWKMFRELLKRDPEIKATVIQCTQRLRKKVRDTRLKIHPLRRRLKGRRAISITGDVRIVFEWKGKHQVRFLAIGGHSVVYGRPKRRKA